MFSDLFQLEQKPVAVFSSDDAGAPILTTDPGSLKTILKACLVTGYGGKPSLGWQMAFESDDKKSAAFKSVDPTASKFYFKINNSGTSSALLSAYQTMTSIDAGENALAVDNDYQLYASSWRLIGHSKAFVLLLDIQGRSRKTAYPLLFGDLPRQISRPTPLCLLWSARRTFSIGSVQSTLFEHPDGNTNANTNADIFTAASYPFKVNAGSAAENLNLNYSRFTYNAKARSSTLYDPVLSSLGDSTWTLIPMLQPLCATMSSVSNLGKIGEIGIRAVTGDYGHPTDNVDCIVPTAWWYA